MPANRLRQRGEVLYHKQEVIDKIAELAVTTAEVLRPLNPILVPMYRGGLEFTDELTRQYHLLDDPFTPPVAPVWVSRYDNGNARTPRIEKPIQIDVAGRATAITDEIIEGGESMDLVEQDLKRRGAIMTTRIVLMKRLNANGRVDYYALGLDGEEWVNGWGADNGLGDGREPEDIIVSLRQPGD
jgi:hypoxanthine-guanine phosphoribosyltransferase